MKYLSIQVWFPTGIGRKWFSGSSQQHGINCNIIMWQHTNNLKDSVGLWKAQLPTMLPNWPPSQWATHGHRQICQSSHILTYVDLLPALPTPQSILNVESIGNGLVRSKQVQIMKIIISSFGIGVEMQNFWGYMKILFLLKRSDRSYQIVLTIEPRWYLQYGHIVQIHYDTCLLGVCS